MKRQTDNVLFEISVMADNAKNLLGMMEQSLEADTLSENFHSVLWVAADYLHRIVEMAESAEKSEVIENNCKS